MHFPITGLAISQETDSKCVAQIGEKRTLLYCWQGCELLGYPWPLARIQFPRKQWKTMEGGVKIILGRSLGHNPGDHKVSGKISLLFAAEVTPEKLPECHMHPEELNLRKETHCVGEPLKTKLSSNH